jgi:hypothetical protein
MGPISSIEKEDYSGLQTCTSCIFLNDYDRVLAADAAGKMDVIRLPQFPRDSTNLRNNRTTLGTAILQELEIVQPPFDYNASSALKLKPLNGGSSFVVGMPTGNYHTVDTERSQVTSSNKFQSARTTQHDSKSSIDAHTAYGPKREYHRERSNPQLSFQRLCKIMDATITILTTFDKSTGGMNASTVLSRPFPLPLLLRINRNHIVTKPCGTFGRLMRRLCWPPIPL